GQQRPGAAPGPRQRGEQGPHQVGDGRPVPQQHLVDEQVRGAHHGVGQAEPLGHIERVGRLVVRADHAARSRVVPPDGDPPRRRPLRAGLAGIGRPAPRPVTQRPVEPAGHPVRLVPARRRRRRRGAPAPPRPPPAPPPRPPPAGGGAPPRGGGGGRPRGPPGGGGGWGGPPPPGPPGPRPPPPGGAGPAAGRAAPPAPVGRR